jgi:CubicO group peptidase (beta-lactamase class C family)
VKATLLVFVALAAGACRREPRPEALPPDARAVDAASALDVSTYRARARVPAIAYAAVTRDATIHEGADGAADVAASRAATRETRFLAASIAKAIVATCVMQLVEEGRIDLDSDVSRWTDFPVRHPLHGGVKITLRMLLVHSASIRDDYPKLAPRDVALGAFLRDYLGRKESWLPDAPGASFAYSNVGTSLAAWVVERVSSAPFGEVAARKVFRPLGMNATAFGACADPARAAPHVFTEGRFVRADRGVYPVYPAVDLWSTPGDLARFARAVLRGGELDGVRVLSAGSVDEMLRDHGGDQGLAWQRRVIHGGRVVGHEGEDAGASAGLFLDAARGAGAIVLANGDAFASGDAARAAALEDLLGELLSSAARTRP